MMKPISAIFTAICATAALWTPASASSPPQEFGLVIVDIKTVATDIAKNIGVQASLIPLTVQVPVSVASGVCGIPETVLGAQGGAPGEAAGVSCEATTTSPQLEQFVRTKVRQQ
ncbi:MAG TPA: hypothetical protein VEC01_18005 [Noviherbaspirillum sp.]|uniref:hypothetical protein n=1 Tax=Noviherbaspirillum sp. TaxID=1926288 RepID=UPI002D542CAB|nr:hypothetical protein [Noviherbaspirillum sp.]HYD97224.1 hypothetical protein [Noviherbaspirillum sp.]